MAFFHESGDHALLSPGGKEEEVDPPELFTRGADATLRLVLLVEAVVGAVPSEVGAKAAPPFRHDAMRKAILIVDILIVPIIL